MVNGMDLEEYIQLLESPTSVDASQVDDLRAMLSYAPYCASARLLLLKALYDAGDPAYQDEMERAMLALPPQTSVYFLLNPRKIKRSQQAYKRYSDGATQTYFEMLEKMHEVADQSGVSFEEITRRYIESRQYTKG